MMAYFGSTAAFLPVFFLLTPILKLLKKIGWFATFAEKTENYFAEKSAAALKKAEKRGGKAKTENFYKTLGVFIFVAIPLPLTGVWTGTAVAVFLGMKFRDAVLPVIIGNFVAGAIISVLAEIVVAVWGDPVILDYVLYGLFALAAITFAAVVFKISCRKKVTAEEKNEFLDRH